MAQHTKHRHHVYSSKAGLAHGLRIERGLTDQTMGSLLCRQVPKSIPPLYFYFSRFDPCLLTCNQSADHASSLYMLIFHATISTGLVCVCRALELTGTSVHCSDLQLYGGLHQYNTALDPTKQYMLACKMILLAISQMTERQNQGARHAHNETLCYCL